jgi:hypothetical protein
MLATMCVPVTTEGGTKNKKPALKRGVVDRVEWTVPHVLIHLSDDATAGSSEWIIKCAAPNKLARNGITRDSVVAGMLVVVQGYWEDEGKHTIVGTKVSLPDGKVLSLQ